MKKLLIADDAEINRGILSEIFSEQFEIIEAEDGDQAVEILDCYSKEISLVLLDLVMPRRSGLEVMEHMTEMGYMKYVPVIMITGESTIESDVKAYEYGASDIIYKPFAAAVVMRRVLNIIELYEHREKTEKLLEDKTRELRLSQEKLEQNNEFLINALSSVVEFRSSESGEHIHRVKKFTKIMLKNLIALYPEYKCLEKDVQQITMAAALHDIGKIAIPDNILLKNGKLTKEEYETMMTHTIKGCEILEKFRMDDSPFYNYCYDICRYHHERYDGKGYPDHLKGDKIPIWAQIVSIVDVFDALISPRVYKLPYDTKIAIQMIYNGECGVFSPKILKCFDSARFEILTIAESSLLP